MTDGVSSRSLAELVFKSPFAGAPFYVAYNVAEISPRPHTNEEFGLVKFPFHHLNPNTQQKIVR